MKGFFPHIRITQVIHTFCLVGILLTVPTTGLRADDVIPNLHRAARWGQAQLVQMLLENGINPNTQDIMGRTALHHGAYYPAVVRVLLEYGANPTITDRFGNTPLHMALSDYTSVQLLIDAGADVNAKNIIGQSPLDRVFRMGNSRRNRETVRIMLAADGSS